MHLLGVDFGQRRVGLARADLDARLAAPWKTLAVRGREDALEQLSHLIGEHSFDRVVVGLPLTGSGESGPHADRIRRIGGALARRTGVEIVFQDEFGSTIEARSRTDHRRRSGPLDAAAAAVILQDYLDAQRKP